MPKTHSNDNASRKDKEKMKNKGIAVVDVLFVDFE